MFKCPSIDKCINNLSYISTMRNNSEIKTIAARYYLDGSKEKYPSEKESQKFSCM